MNRMIPAWYKDKKLSISFSLIFFRGYAVVINLLTYVSYVTLSFKDASMELDQLYNAIQ